MGPIKGKSKTEIYLGVELDDAVGKHNGTVKNHKYFSCRDRYGYMAPAATFELFGKSKKGGKKDKKDKDKKIKKSG